MRVLRGNSTRPFRDRAEAGRELATHLRKYAGKPDALVLALPRGGVPVGFEVACSLDVDLDVILVRKLGVPGREELAMGAVATSGAFYIDEWLVDRLEITPEQISAVVEREQQELARREREYRDGRPPPQIREKVVICVDDGLATGASMRVAVTALRQGHPARIVVAVPVAAPTVAEELRALADEVVVARMPANFRAVSLWYENFAQTTDEEVRELLSRAATRKR
jgi:putative phosphoribosyl transferase